MTHALDRNEWAARTVASTAPRRVLELGCGRGVALGSLAELLPDAQLVGVDRSPAAISAARARLGDAGDRIRLVRAGIAGLEVGEPGFDVVFAVNVNAFWLAPDRELATVRRLLAPDGRLLLFYEPPSEGQGERIAHDGADRLASHGFEVTWLRHPLSKGVGIGFVAR